MSFESAQGINFTFGGHPYTATSISVSKSSGEFNCTSTAIPPDANGNTCISRYRAGGLKTIEIKVDWISDGSVPQMNEPLAIVLAATGAPGLTGAQLGGEPIGGLAVCTGLSVNGAAGDLLRGSATFKLTKD